MIHFKLYTYITSTQARVDVNLTISQRRCKVILFYLLFQSNIQVKKCVQTQDDYAILITVDDEKIFWCMIKQLERYKPQIDYTVCKPELLESLQQAKQGE